MQIVADKSVTRPRIIFELCAETIQACLAAFEGGADRIELCSALVEGGLTPSHGLISQAVQYTGLPVHVLLRPRVGNFHYSDADVRVMLDDLAHVKTTGAAGVVLGLLHDDNTVDVARTRMLVEQAVPLEVTFHRAFDETPSLPEALEDVITSGCQRVLTSGGTGIALAGSATLKHLLQQAAGRIEIAVGGNLRMENAAQLARSTGAVHFHSALRQQAAPAEMPWHQTSPDVLPAEIAILIQQLRSGL